MNRLPTAEAAPYADTPPALAADAAGQSPIQKNGTCSAKQSVAGWWWSTHACHNSWGKFPASRVAQKPLCLSGGVTLTAFGVKVLDGCNPGVRWCDREVQLL